MSWTKLTLQVRTPLFGGDDPRHDDGGAVRVPSIRGVLRFWFRAVASGHHVSDLGEIWKAEQAVFGSTSTPSVIRLRIPKQPTVSSQHRKPDWAISERLAKRPGFDGAQYLLGQGLWDYERGLRRGCVEPGQSFDLDIRFDRDEQVNSRFMLALWAWLTYGGLGCRTRRGFGQLVCTAVDGDLPCHWTLDNLKPPSGVAGWENLGACAVPDLLPGRAALGWGDLLQAPPPKTDSHPEIPTLSPRWWAGTVLETRAGSLGEALHRAGLRWRRFRAADDDARGRKPSQNTRSPEWLNSIHGDDDRYPIAAFGLPIGYFSSASGFKATVTPELGGAPLRRASPVWLRPILLPKGRWGVFTHVFYSRLLPKDAVLRISTGTSTLSVPSDEVVEEAWDCWLHGDPRLPDDYFPRREHA